MRIAIVGPVQPWRGGVSQYTSQLANRLARDGDEVLVVSWARQYPRVLYPGREQLGEDSAFENHVERRFLLDYRDPRSWAGSARAIRSWRAELAVFTWVTTFPAPIYLFLALALRLAGGAGHARPRLAAICHNVLPHERRPFDRLLTRVVLQRMDGCIVHSTRDLAELASVAPDVHGVSLFLPQFDARPAREAVDRVGARRIHGSLDTGFAPGDNVILFFGFVRPYKGLRYLLEALPGVLREMRVTLLVVGEFWEDRQAYEALIGRLGVSDHVRIVDRYVDDREMSRYFDAADVVVLPYVEASQSAVVRVAFAHGTPVISTAVGGIPESVDDGVTGLLVPPADSEALTRAILRFYQPGESERLRAGVARATAAAAWDPYLRALRAIATR